MFSQKEVVFDGQGWFMSAGKYLAPAANYFSRVMKADHTLPVKYWTGWDGGVIYLNRITFKNSTLSADGLRFHNLLIIVYTVSLTDFYIIGYLQKAF